MRVAPFRTLGFALLVSGAAIAFAQAPPNTSFRVTASVQGVCTVSASDLAFGQYDVQGTSAKLATTTISATCSPAMTYQVGITQGSGPGATEQVRKMQGAGGATLNYALYQDEGRTQIWGNTAGQNMLTGTGTGQNVSHTVYGSIPQGQVVPPNEFGDTVTVRMLY